MKMKTTAPFKKNRLSVIIFLFLTLSGIGCSHLRCLNPFVRAKGSLYGEVHFSGDDGKLSEGVYISIRSKVGSYDLPVVDGIFCIENIEGAAYFLTITKNGKSLYVGNIRIVPDSTALINFDSSIDIRKLLSGKETEYNIDCHYIERRPFGERGAIEGVIKSSLTGKGYNDASVYLQGTNIWSAETDSAGCFRMDSILPGTYTLVVRPRIRYYSAGYWERKTIYEVRVKNGYASIINEYLSWSDGAMPFEMPLPWKEDYRPIEK
jgi:hypothetical protein